MLCDLALGRSVARLLEPGPTRTQKTLEAVRLAGRARSRCRSAPDQRVSALFPFIYMMRATRRSVGSDAGPATRTVRRNGPYADVTSQESRTARLSTPGANQAQRDLTDVIQRLTKYAWRAVQAGLCLAMKHETTRHACFVRIRPTVAATRLPFAPGRSWSAPVGFARQLPSSRDTGYRSSSSDTAPPTCPDAGIVCTRWTPPSIVAPCKQLDDSAASRSVTSRRAPTDSR